MVPKDQLGNLPSIHELFASMPRIYGPEHVTSDRRHLEIEMDGKSYLLPFKEVGDPQNSAFIAYLSTKLGENGDLLHASAREMAPMIERLDPLVVCTPPSRKSTEFVRSSVRKASVQLGHPINIVIFVGGESDYEITRLAPRLKVAYHPVTSREPKYMGLTEDQARLIAKVCPDGNRILVVDDVYSMGATMNAIHSLTRSVLGVDDSVNFPVSVLAFESAYGPNYPAQPPPHVYPLIHIPVFIGGIPNPLEHFAR